MPGWLADMTKGQNGKARSDVGEKPEITVVAEAAQVSSAAKKSSWNCRTDLYSSNKAEPPQPRHGFGEDYHRHLSRKSHNTVRVRQSTSHFQNAGFVRT
jgi:hypothetical protein